jgi:hypothetical protein
LNAGLGALAVMTRESSYERCQRCQSCHATIYPPKQVTIKQITYVYCVLCGMYGTLGVVSSDDIALGFASCYITFSTAPLVPYVTCSTVTVRYLFIDVYMLFIYDIDEYGHIIYTSPAIAMLYKNTLNTALISSTSNVVIASSVRTTTTSIMSINVLL